MDMLDFIVQHIMRPFTESVFKLLNEGLYLTGFYNAFYIEETIGLSEDFLFVFDALLCAFAMLLLLGKLLWKLFNIYILGVDGDNTVSPLEYLKSYVKGLIVIATFTVAYGWLGDICHDFLKEIQSVLNMQSWDSYDTFLNGINGVFMFVYSLYLVYF